MPQSWFWNSLKRRSIWAVMRPTGPAVAPGQEVLGLGVLEERVALTVEEPLALETEAEEPSWARYDRAATAA